MRTDRSARARSDGAPFRVGAPARPTFAAGPVRRASVGAARQIADSGARRRLALVFSLALSAACAHAGARPPATSAPSAELELLRSQLAERERTIAQLESRIALLTAGPRARRDEFAEPNLEPPDDGVTGELSAVNERPVSEPARSREPALRSADARTVLRLHEGGRRESVASTWTVPSTNERLKVVPVPELPKLGAEREDVAEDLYIRALDLVRRREFPEALRELDAFIRGFPQDPRCARALFWRGEVLFAQREYALALEAFDTALEREPDGDKAPDALLRIARCHLRLGANERARAILAQLEAQFPDSEAARLAKRMMQEDS